MSNPHVDMIKDRLSISDVVGSYLKLESSGRSLKACCPFHTEKTPSFFVVPDKNIFHCFGCGKGGDIFSFVEAIEGISFLEALRMLAERAGVSLDERVLVEDKTIKEGILETLDLATRFYEVSFRKDPEVVSYVLSRGLTKETAVSFRIGYARPEWNALLLMCLSKGISRDVLLKTGLFTVGKDGKMYDRFRNRIMFPIFDPQGRVVAFSGRVYDARNDGRDAAKYINSPETEVYHKSKILYGYDRAKDALRTSGRAVVVEGQFDLVLAHQAGTQETVALSGTSLTEEHVKLLGRFVRDIILALDGDAAGIRASYRSAEKIFEGGFDAKAVVLPEGEDPASLVARNEDAWTSLIQNPKDYFDVCLGFLSHEKSSGVASSDISRVKSELFPLVAVLPTAMGQDRALQKISHAFSISDASVRDDYRRWSSGRQEKVVEKKVSVPTLLGDLESTLQALLFVLEDMGDTEEKYRNDFIRIMGSEKYEALQARAKDLRNEFVLYAEKVYPTTNKAKITRCVEEILIRLEMRILSERRRELFVLLKSHVAPDPEHIVALEREIGTINASLDILTSKLSHL